MLVFSLCNNSVTILFVFLKFFEILHKVFFSKETNTDSLVVFVFEFFFFFFFAV